MLGFVLQDPLIRIILLVAIFAVVVFAAVYVMNLIGRRIMVRTQIREMAAGALEVVPSARALRSVENDTAWSRIAAAVEKAGLNLTDTNDERLTKRLRAAGFSSPAAPRVFTLVRLVMLIVLPLSYVSLSYFSGNPPSFLKLYLIGSLLALLGLYLPNIYVQARADRRKEAIVNGFPDCLDLLLVCVESGLGLEAAMDRVGREMALSHPLVAELLSITTLQLRAGASREEAFRKLSGSAQVEEIRSFTTLLIQSDRLGTSISSTMRVYAAEMREKRRMRAEEKAHRLPVLISIPLVACMLPVMIGTLMLPAVVMVVRDIFPLMLGR
ncbi:type II secretion system F family protein [Novosphingobium sp. ZN18A2]|uniref:type II secretion system F family protein n=1 Tax=Novosphingobium sp. ZN18A2 TaxID=3079861 RepID=UPI0030CCB736